MADTPDIPGLHPSDVIHVQLDACWALKLAILNGPAKPWSEYDGPVEEDPKAGATTYMRVLELAIADLTRELDECPSKVSAVDG